MLTMQYARKTNIKLLHIVHKSYNTELQNVDLYTQQFIIFFP